MNQQQDGQYTLPVTQETAEWLQELGGYGSFNDIIMMLLRFYDAYRLDHKNTHDDLSRALQSALPAAGDESWIKAMDTVFNLKPGAISFTVRERLTGMMLPHERKIILTFYINHVPFCLAYLSREGAGKVTFYIPSTNIQRIPDKESSSSDEDPHFSGWKSIATISSDDSVNHEEIIQPIQAAFNRAYQVSNALRRSSPGPGKVDDKSERKEKQFRFWKELIDRINRKELDLFSKCTPKEEGRLVAGGGFTGTVFTYTLQNNSVIVSFRISKDKKKEQMKISGLFAKLMEFREEIERAFGGSLDWVADERKRFDYIRIILRNGGLIDEDRWPEIQEEMIETMERLKDAITPSMKRIMNSENQQ
jgi:hypothetical protein